jgi:hypothetical protein
MNGSEILTEAHNLVNGPRQDTYSHPFDDYFKVKELFRTMTGIQLTVHQAVTFMICVKLARIATNAQRGDWHRDSVVDAAGYLACLSMVHEHVQNEIGNAVTRFNNDC